MYITDYSLNDEMVKIIDNTGASMNFFKKVTRIAESIFKQEVRISRETELLLRVSISSPTDKLDQEALMSQETEPMYIITTVVESTEA